MPNTSCNSRAGVAQLDLFAHAAGRPAPLWSIRLGGRTVRYTLKRSPRARQVWLRIGIGTGLVVVAPPKTPIRELEKLLEKKAGWIERHLTRIDLPGGGGRGYRLTDGAKLPYLGAYHRLRVVAGRAPGQVKLAGGEIVAAVPGKNEFRLKETLEAWYRKMARKVIAEKVDRLKGGRTVGRITIRDQKTRWGSCSSKGNMSFNWRLVMAPPSVIDYLVIHELTHMEHPDHSKRFWARLGKLFPGYEEQEAWLTKHGNGLTL